MRAWTKVFAFLVACGTAFAAQTPINNLVLQGNANGGTNSFTNLVSVGLVDGANQSFLTQKDVGTLQGTLPTNELKELFSKTPSFATSSPNAVVTKDYVSSTNLGNEGFRRIGALGGYTLEEFIEDIASRGAARDLPTFVYTSTNLVVSWSGGDVYEPTVGYYHLQSGINTALTDNAVNFAYWSTNDVRLVQWTTGTRPEAVGNIYLGTFSTSLGKIIQVDLAAPVGDELLQEDVAFSRILPSVIIDGMRVIATNTGLTDITFIGGIEYQNMATEVNHDTFSFSTSNKLVYYSHSSSNWASFTTNLFPIGLWDDGTNVSGTEAANWYRGVFVSIPNSGQLTWIMPDYAYTNETDAIAGNDPDVPSGFFPYVPKCTAYVFKGDDVILRDSTVYWVDRRNSYNLLKGASTGGGGGSANTPTLQQVLIAGNGTGGILPSGMGLPMTSDQAANKGYVDSTINNVNTKKAYVDVKGDDGTAKVESSILPFKTIQAAIDACTAYPASETNRFLVVLSPGFYIENVTMKNFISMRGDDSEATVIIGTVTFPPAFTDVTGSEIALITIQASNTNAVDINLGADRAYVGLRSCFLVSTYDNDVEYKSLARAGRGLIEFYATTYGQLNIFPTNGGGVVSDVQIFEHTTSPANNGLSQFTSFASSCEINCADTNDNINMLLTHDNLDSGCINTFIGGLFNVFLNVTNEYYSNDIRIVAHEKAIGRTLSMGNVLRVYMNPTNGCRFFMAWSKDGTGDNVAIVRNNHVRMVSGSSSNIWLGAACTTNDNIRIFDTEIIQANAFNYYPKIYTNDGVAGYFYVNTPHQNGDHIFGGSIDLSLMNSGVPSTPDSGHVRMYAYTYAGLENPNFIDSSGNRVRLARDHFFNGYNSETTTLQVGETVYVTAGLSAAGTPVVGRANGNNPAKMPCAGLVVQVGGIGTNRIGRVMRGGRTEQYFDTSAFASGDKLYVSATVDGGITNVAPTGTNIAQQIGWCHISSTNGYMNVYLFTPDTLGGLTPQNYATYANPVFASSLFTLTNGGAARFDTADIPAGTTNNYMFPSAGGLLATYTDIQLVPVSVKVGESGGIAKGRVVYQSGVSSGKPVVKYADRRNSDTLPVIGVTMDTGNMGDNIEVANFGPLNDVDMSSFETNDLLYLGTNGFLSGPSSVSTDAIIMLGTCMSNSVTGSMLVNIRSYYMDGSFSGPMRYTVKNASASNNASAQIQAVNNDGYRVSVGITSTNSAVEPNRTFIYSAGYGSMRFNQAGAFPFIWAMDMENKHDDRNYNNWPIMSLVPQANSNAFLGIGTTNPLAKLHVTGSILASNTFRLASGAYSSTELITYADSTNLIGILQTNMQTQINSATNGLTNEVIARVAGDTNLQAQIVAETNRAFTAENSISNSLNVAITNISAQLVTETNRAYVVETNLQIQIITETNRAYVAETNLQAQIDATTNRVKGLESITSNWNSAYAWSTNDPIQDTNVSVAVLGLYAVTNSWGFNEPVPTNVVPYDLYLSAAFPKARSLTNFRAITEVGAVLGQIVIRSASNPIRTYTVLTNFAASTTSTNAVILTGTILAENCIGVVITNVGNATNFWFSTQYSTTNGLKDL